jgi:hypothetical protein
MTMRWNAAKGKEEESAKVDAFLNEVKQVCMRHGLTLEHEDGHGAFEVETCTKESDTDWFMAAGIGYTLEHIADEDATNNKGE